MLLTDVLPNAVVLYHHRWINGHVMSFWMSSWFSYGLFGALHNDEHCTVQNVSTFVPIQTKCTLMSKINWLNYSREINFMSQTLKTYNTHVIIICNLTASLQ